VKECFTCRRCFGDHNEKCAFDGSPLLITLPGSPIIANKYRLDIRLDKKPTGVIYLGFDFQRRQLINITIVLPENFALGSDYRERFETLLNEWRKLQHPNILPVVAFGLSTQNVFYIVTESIEGRPLSALLAEGPLPFKQVPNIVEQLCQVVTHIHQIPWYGNLTPQKFLIVESRQHLYLADFGLSRLPLVGSTGMLKHPYRAPELLRGEEHGETSDVYSVGIMAYQLLTGQLPTEINSGEHWVEPAWLRDLPEGVSNSLQVVILRALEKDSRRRLQSVAVLNALLQIALSKPAELRDRQVMWRKESNRSSYSLNRPATGAHRPVEQPRGLDSERLTYREPRPVEDRSFRTLVAFNPRPKENFSGEGFDLNVGSPPTIEQESELAAAAEAMLQEIANGNEFFPLETVPPLAAYNSPVVDNSPVADLANAAVAKLPTTSSTEAFFPASSLPSAEPTSPILPPTIPNLASDQAATPANQASNLADFDTNDYGTNISTSANVSYNPDYAPDENANDPSLDTKLSISKSMVEALQPSFRNENEPTEIIVRLSPASVVYLFANEFLPPRQGREYKREVYRGLVAREALAALLIVTSISSLVKVRCLALLPIARVAAEDRAQLNLGDDEEMLLQMINHTDYPTDELEKRLLASFAGVNLSSIKNIYRSLVSEARRRVVTPAEALNDLIAEELVQRKLLETAVLLGRREPGQTERAYRYNEPAIETYRWQIDEIKELLATLSEKAIMNDQSFGEYLQNYYHDLFLQYVP
jgi:serine/threonine protein kinase